MLNITKPLDFVSFGGIIILLDQFLEEIMEKLKRNIDMTEGPFFKKMLVFAVPLIISGLLQAFYNAADLIVVGHYRGDFAVAAVGGTSSISHLVIGLFMGMSVGAGVCVAHHIGAKEQGEVKKVVSTSLILSAVLGVLIGAVGFFISEDLLILMDTPEAVLPHATLYMQIIFLGTPASLVYNYAAAMMRSAGDSRKPMIFLAVSGVVNVVLNVFLVVVFGMGVDGVAIATIVAQYLSAVISLVYLTRTSGPLRFSFKTISFDLSKFKKILYIGIPSGIQGCLFSLSNVVIQSSVNGFGDVVMAGSAASANLEAFMYIAMNSIYHVALTFIGQNVGAKKYKNIRRVTIYCCILVSAIGLISGALFLLLRYPLVSLYVSSEEAMTAAFERLWIIASTYFLCGNMEVFCAGLRSLNRSVTAMIISLCGACGLRILWIYTVFEYWYHEPIGIYVSYPITWIVTSLTHLLFMTIIVKRIMRKEADRQVLEIISEE